MSLKIRLARAGAKKRPFYRIVVADSRSPRDGRFIDKLGTYNPLLPRDHAERVRLDEERVRQWLVKGAQPTDRVLRFLDAAGLIKRPARYNPTKAQPVKKAQERAAARAAAAPASAARTSWRLNSSARPAAQGFMSACAPPAQAKYAISFTGQTRGGRPVSSRCSRAKAAA